jgi:IclR family KDG regulon transcriptional repressor
VDASRTADFGQSGTQALATVGRALDVLELIAACGAPVSLAELSARLGMSKSAAHRLVVTLRERGFLRQLPDRSSYVVGIKSFEVGAAFLSQTSLRSASLPEMEHLSRLTQETIHLVTLEGMDVVYLEKINSPRPYSVSTRVGSRSPAYCTAVGKAILAFLNPARLEELLRRPLERYTPRTICHPEALKDELARVRSRGYAVDREEIEPNLCCLGAPIFDHGREPAGAIGIAGPADRMLRRMDEDPEEVRAAAQRISASLGHLAQ